MRSIFVIVLLSFINIGLKAQSVFNITATIPYNNSYASGTYKIYRSSSNANITLSNLRKPIVFVEGFDPNNVFSIGAIAQMLYSGSPQSTSLASQLNNLGYDIIILNFDQGGDYIQKNAYLLVELLKQINIQKPNKNEPLTVIGYSMGGLVARYALTYMEEHETSTNPHQTRLFVSYDSPQRGAHVPVGIQALALTFDYDLYKQLLPDLAASIYQFNAPAAKQMLKYRITSATQASGEIPISPDYIAFMSELNGLNGCNGYPKKCRNIALSLGSWNGVGQRSNLDLDQNGTKDLQHASFPMLYINIPKGTGDNTKTIGQLNTCDFQALTTFQIFLSTSFSDNYPYFSQRSNYANLGTDAFVTYWYAQGSLFSFFPSGAWSRGWWYKDKVPADFAPGSFSPLYYEILSSLNSRVVCSFSYADNSTFVPTVSALAFDTDDLFYNISNDPNKLDKTPFDAIYGIDGDNTSHITGQTSNTIIKTALIDEISHNYGSTCATNLKSLTGTVNSGQNVSISGTSNIEASNYLINSGSNVILEAGQSIVFLPGFNEEKGSVLSASIVKCPSKSCFWKPTISSMLMTTLINNDSINIINWIPKSNFVEKEIVEKDLYLNIYPNPNNGIFTVSTNIESGNLNIINSMGVSVLNTQISTGLNTLNINIPPGLYEVILMNESRKVFKQKMIVK